MLGLAATTARQGTTLWSSRHCGDGEVWRYELELGVGRSQLVRVGCVGPEQVFRRTEKNNGVILRQQTPLSYPSQKNSAK